MTTAYYSTVLNHPLETVWDLIRDFNNYPAYIDGVSESVIEDDKGGDEVGAVRRFCYLGNWIRQRLAGHSDEAHSLTYAGIEPLPFPAEADAGRARADALSGDDAPAAGRRGQPDIHRMGRDSSTPRRRMPSAGRRCSSPGFRTGRIRSKGR